MRTSISKIIALLLCIILGLSIISTTSLTSQAASDEPSSWALAEVNEAIDNELIPMHMQNNYTDPISREDFCELVVYFIETYSDMGMPAFTTSKTLKALTESPFSDIDNANVNSANVLGIANGYPDGTFKPGDSIERQAASKMLAATAFALGYATDGTAQTSFTDQGDISSWATTYVNYVYELGIMNGVGENNFDPHGTYQRQMAYMTINRLYTNLADATMSEYPPQDARQYYSYGLGNAGPYTLKYTYEVNHTDYIDYTYYDDGNGNGREDKFKVNYLGAEFILNHYTQGDTVYIVLPEKEMMTSYKTDKNSTIMTKILEAVNGEFMAARIEGGKYIYEYRTPFIHDEELFFNYTFTSENGDFTTMRVDFNNVGTEYYFKPLEFGEVSADLFVLPTGYQTTTHDYVDDGEHSPFWWELTND